MNDSERKAYLKAVGSYCKEQRIKQDVTLADLAYIADVSEDYIERFENGEIDMPLDKVVLLTHFLNIPFEKLSEIHLEIIENKKK
ncbi:helix-turn-helix domain-containing protein [Gracilibacillus marinus]|jgi:transcriptional regulator with XRE-family HTH domain|uniref:Helix-turn-helix domain-containing protein n=1 Tax=Gracilibacillus marinus TaxID=630535 RepID=A0ABV8VQY7_9BACI